MKKWLGEPELQIEILTDWKVGNPVLIKGFHHVAFQNKGVVQLFEYPKIIQYSQLSSVSHLPDKKENYAIIAFKLSSEKDGISLTVRIENFPTESIYKHLAFYWAGTLPILKKLIEKESF